MDAKLLFSGDLFASVFMQVLTGSDFESSGSWDDTLVLGCVDNCSEAVFDGISGLSN
jgi:hypothetical protein